MGIYGNDSPVELIDYLSTEVVTKEVINQKEDVDLALFVNGDFNSHGMSLEEPYPTDPAVLNHAYQLEVKNFETNM